MKFCIQRSLAQPGKHAKFQQGCRGRKAKGGKAIKAGGQNFQKSFFQFFCASVCALHPFLGILCPISLMLCKLPTVACVTFGTIVSELSAESEIFWFVIFSCDRAGVNVCGVRSRFGPLLHQYDPVKRIRPFERRLRLLRDIKVRYVNCRQC